MPSALLVAGLAVSARNLGLLFPKSSEDLLYDWGRCVKRFSGARAGEIEARSKVGEGTVRSMEGDSVGVASGEKMS